MALTPWVTGQVGVLDGTGIEQINAIADAVRTQRGARVRRQRPARAT